MSALMAVNGTPICVSSSRRRGEPEARYSCFIKTSPCLVPCLTNTVPFWRDRTPGASTCLTELINFVASTQTAQTEADPRPEQRTDQCRQHQSQGRRSEE